MLFFSRIIISIVSCVVLWGGLVYFQVGNQTQSSRWLSEAYDLKESYASTINKKKIVIVSGSNSLFGIDSSKIEKVYGFPVVNHSVHAGLGLPYILSRSQNILNKGDIAILPLEYSFYQSDDKPSEVYSDYLLSRDEQYFRRLPTLEKIKIISRISFLRLFQGLNLHFNSALTPTKGVYGVQNINKYGDQINIERVNADLSRLERIKPEELTSSALSETFIYTMGNYIKWAEKIGVCLIFTPPNYMFFDAYNKDLNKEFLSNIKGFYESNKKVFLGEPFSHMFEKEFYFNTRYHLNSLGVDKRTALLTDDIGIDIRTHCKTK